MFPTMPIQERSEVCYQLYSTLCGWHTQPLEWRASLLNVRSVLRFSDYLPSDSFLTKANRMAVTLLTEKYSFSTKHMANMLGTVRALIPHSVNIRPNTQLALVSEDTREMPILLLTMMCMVV